MNKTQASLGELNGVLKHVGKDTTLEPKAKATSMPRNAVNTEKTAKLAATISDA